MLLKAETMTHFVNLNATWDTVLLLDSLKMGAVNKAAAAVSYPGGKGNNAARTVALLGGKPRLYAFCGQADKARAAEFYKKAKVEATLHAVEGRNRPCVITLDAAKDQETVVNSPSQIRIRPADLAALRKALLKQVKPGDLVAFSGSLPEGLRPETYRDMIREVQAKGGIALLDGYGPALKFGVEAAPLIVKPNVDELGASFGWKVRTREDILAAADKLLRKGVRAVVVTLGARGAIVKTAREALYVAPLSQPRGWHSPVGCGDAFFGALCWGLDKNLDYRDCLRWATASAWANLHMPGAIFFDPKLVKAQLPLVRISKLGA
jgi:1-phosphofructokinase family hexose kinase